MSACGGASASPGGATGKVPAALASSSASPGDPAAAPTALDLSIIFDPELSDDIGWMHVDTPVGLQYPGGPAAAVQRFDEAWQQRKDDAIAQKVFEIQLGRLSWPSTSVVLNEKVLCSPQLQEAVNRARPARLLLRIDGGITSAGVACLRSLTPPRLYLAGCLHRAHRREDRCDGDAELRALASDETVRTRVGGLAVSLSKGESLARLGQLPALEYLAIASGREPDVDARFDSLPFAELKHVRYLDITSWRGDQLMFGAPDQLRFVGGLHTLRWHGELTAPLRECQLRRFYDSLRIRDEDVRALATCGQLVELSTLSAGFRSLADLQAFPRLERLYLHHSRAEDLSPLAKLTALRELDLPGSKASDFSVAARLPELRAIDVSQTALEDLSAFAKLAHLERLDVHSTRVSSLTPLSGLHTLVDLELHRTGVVDLAPLAGLRLLKTLSVSETAVTDLSPLDAHPTLEWLILYDSKIRDVGALLTMPRLKRAHLGGLSLPPAQLAALKNRPGLELDGAR